MVRNFLFIAAALGLILGFNSTVMADYSDFIDDKTYTSLSNSCTKKMKKCKDRCNNTNVKKLSKCIKSCSSSGRKCWKAAEKNASSRLSRSAVACENTLL